jgi:two-component system, LuxR family, sensor kinase FixL
MSETEASSPVPEIVGEREIWARFLDPLFNLSRRMIFIIVFSMMAVIALADWYVERNLSLGVLYTFPIVFAAMTFRRSEMVLLVAVCTVLREHLAPFSWQPDVQQRLFYTALSYGGVGLLLNEIARNRRLMVSHYRELREQIERRRTAEAQFGALVESSPAAILTLGPDGRIEIANTAAEQIFAVERGALLGRVAADYLPVLADLVQQDASGIVYRATTTGVGRRANGESFHAYIWFSTLPSSSGNRLAAIIVDGSEDLRDWQEASLQSILRSTRVLVGSVSHEIRNLAAAIVMVHSNLGRIPGVSESEDYSALNTLAQGLARLATVELNQAAESDLTGVNLKRLVDEFCIIVAPSLEAIDGELVQDVPADTPLVLGDHQGLIQVLMNLSRNSIRAMDACDARKLILRVGSDQHNVFLRLIDTGPGVLNPDLAFQPFQPGADASGLGLFVSRAIIRGCQGELYHEPSPTGCTMVIKLKVYPLEDTASELNETEVQA